MTRPYSTPTYFLDFDHPSIRAIVSSCTDLTSQREKAVALYDKVRDGWRYNPNVISLEKEAFRASTIASKKDGHCIEKAILLVACLRAVDIPARLQLAKVKNHIGVERLIEKFGTNELTPHGMVSMFLDGCWLKASPAFNRELCEKLDVAPLDFDGRTDSVFQEYDRKGNVFMEYLEDYGTFSEVPIDFIFRNFREHYPAVYKRHRGKRLIQL